MSHSSDTSSQVAALDSLRARVNTAALVDAASARRGATPCRLVAEDPAYGVYHAVWCLEFSDGTKWAVKSPLIYDDLAGGGEEVAVRALAAEAAFLRYASTALPSLPIPRLHHFDPHGGSVGVPFLLLDWVPGRVIHVEKDPPPPNVVERMLDQVASFLVQFTYGSITPPHHTWSSPMDKAPLSSATSYLLERVDLVIQRFCLCLGGPSFGGGNLQDLLILRSLVKAAVPPELERGPFPIYHSDFNWYNMLWDDGYELTGVIDWSGGLTCTRVPLFVVALLPFPEVDPTGRRYLLSRLRHHEALYIGACPDHPATRRQTSLATIADSLEADAGVLDVVSGDWAKTPAVAERAVQRGSKEWLRTVAWELNDFLRRWPQVEVSEMVVALRASLA